MRRRQVTSRFPQFRPRNTTQTSRGKFSRLPCTVAGSTLRVLDGYGLRDTLPARPTLTPDIRFLSINSHICSALPSDPASRRQPLRIANPSPPSGSVEDFHLQATEHARHTTKSLCDSPLMRAACLLVRQPGWRSPVAGGVPCLEDRGVVNLTQDRSCL